jgi:hypothetical protein
MACPICHRKTDPGYRPFCSRRCADIDLGRWLTGAYAIPGDAPDAGGEPRSASVDTASDGARLPRNPDGSRRH